MINKPSESQKGLTAKLARIARVAAWVLSLVSIGGLTFGFAIDKSTYFVKAFMIWLGLPWAFCIFPLIYLRLHGVLVGSSEPPSRTARTAAKILVVLLILFGLLRATQVVSFVVFLTCRDFTRIHAANESGGISNNSTLVKTQAASLWISKSFLVHLSHTSALKKPIDSDLPERKLVAFSERMLSRSVEDLGSLSRDRTLEESQRKMLVYRAEMASALAIEVILMPPSRSNAGDQH